MIYNDVIVDKATFEDVQKTNAFYQNFEITGVTPDNEITFECKLLIDNKCSIYNKRPFLCRNYPSTKMFKHGGSLHKNCTYELKARKEFDFYFKNYMKR
jgi:Fe-S-cluster containining protein